MAPKEQTLTLRLAGLTEDLDAEACITIFHLTIETLKDINRNISEFGAANVQWKIVAAGKSSPFFATLEGFGTSPESADFGPKIASAFVTGFQLLSKSDACPPFFTEKSLRQARAIVGAFALGISGIEFSTEDRSVEINKQVAVNATAAIRKIEADRARKSGEYIEHGEIEGQLKELSELAARDKLLIVDDLTGVKTVCYVRGPDLEQQVRNAWKHRICASGRMTVNRLTGNPTEMQVESIRILRPRSELPQIDDIIGIDIAGGIESSEFVRSLRDAE